MSMHSVKNRALGKSALKPRQLRLKAGGAGTNQGNTMPGYSHYGMQDPTMATKRVNKGMDNTKK